MNHEQICLKTLEFLISHTETLEDLDLLQTTIEDYKEQGYDLKPFLIQYHEQIQELKFMLNYYNGTG